MFKFLKKLFTPEEPHVPEGLIDTKYNCVEIKNGKLTKEERIDDELFFIHEFPTPYPRNDTMPSHVEQQDNINTSQVEIIDERTGKKIMVDASQLAQLQEKIPDGVNVPGLGKIGSKKPSGQAPQQQRPQQRPSDKPQVATQPGPQQPQNAPRQNPIPAQQGYPQQQPQQPQQPQGYPQGYPQQGYPQQGYPQQPQGYPQQPYNPVPNYPQPMQQIPVNQSAGYLPPSEIAMIDGAYHIYVDLPGVKKETLKVSFNAGTLVVSGERLGSIENLRKEIKGPRGRKDPILTEHNTVPPYLVGKFEFKYPFQRLIDESKMEANVDNGVLHVVLPHRVKGEEVTIPIM